MHPDAARMYGFTGYACMAWRGCMEVSCCQDFIDTERDTADRQGLRSDGLEASNVVTCILLRYLLMIDCGRMCG